MHSQIPIETFCQRLSPIPHSGYRSKEKNQKPLNTLAGLDNPWHSHRTRCNLNMFSSPVKVRGSHYPYFTKNQEPGSVPWHRPSLSVFKVLETRSESEFWCPQSRLKMKIIRSCSSESPVDTLSSPYPTSELFILPFFAEPSYISGPPQAKLRVLYRTPCAYVRT